MTEARDNAGVIAPPPLIALAAVVLGLALDWLLPAYVLTVLLTLRERVVIAVILIGAGAALAIPALRGFRSAGTHVEPWKPSTRAGDRRHIRLAAQSDVCRPDAVSRRAVHCSGVRLDAGDDDRFHAR